MNALEKAISRRDHFLSEHPELKDMQNSIDYCLHFYEDPVTRCLIMSQLMSHNVALLRFKLDELLELTEELGSKE